MAIAVANSWGANSATASATVTIAGVATGDLLIAFGFGFSTTSITFNTPGFTDNGVGSSWANHPDSGYVNRTRVIGADTIVGATPPTTVTATHNGGGGSTSAIAVLRVTGAASSAAHDASVGNAAVSATPSTAALTTLNANDLIAIALSHDNATTTLVKPTGFTQSASAVGSSTNTDATNIPYAVAWQVVSLIQSGATYQWTCGASVDAEMVAGGWKAASAAAAGAGLPQTFAAIPFMSTGRI